VRTVSYTHASKYRGCGHNVFWDINDGFS
jgi:hypothetical protein